MAPVEIAVPAVCESLPERLRQHAERWPEKTVFTFLNDGETQTLSLTFGALDRIAESLAAELNEKGAKPGDRVLLLFPPGLSFIAAFFACLRGGLLAVPAYPPSGRKVSPALVAIVADARPEWALTTPAILRREEPLTRALAPASPIRWLAVRPETCHFKDATSRPQAVPPGMPAFLQYTSGSTGDPKGVVVTHGNLVHNQEMIRNAFGQTPDSVVVGWLPLYHDMGLIGNVLQPVFSGSRCILMAPMAFLQKPVRWLMAITRFQATTSGGPDFAYRLCSEKIPEQERGLLDLRRWRIAFNGAEPVRAKTLTVFAETFGHHGFSAGSFFPCYGLAEATLFVSGVGKESGPWIRSFASSALELGNVEGCEPQTEGSQALVACGSTRQGQRVRIVDPHSLRACAPKRIGEIWVGGESVAGGYWGRPRETRRDFRARLREDDASQTYLRTGDLGFFEGEHLFIAGRLKDLIIIRGRNHYPQDIEATAEASHAALRSGGCAAFSVQEDDAERLVLVQELERTHLRNFDKVEVVEAIENAIASSHGLQVHALYLVKPGILPKTSSNKVRRRACRDLLRGGSLAIVASHIKRKGNGGPLFPESEPASQTGPSGLRELAGDLLGIDPATIAENRPLAGLGFDSLLATQLQFRAEMELGMDLRAGDILAGATLASLAGKAEPRTGGESGIKTQTVPDPGTEPYPLSHNQQAVWFLHRLDPGSAAYNLSFAVEIFSEVDGAGLRGALHRLQQKHPALRTGFTDEAGEPAQRVRGCDLPFREVDTSGWSRDRLRQALSDEAHRPFDLTASPLWRVSFFVGNGRGILLWVMHHIVGDFYSLLVLMDELGAAYGKPQEPKPSATGNSSYASFVAWQRRMLDGAEGQRLRRFWLKRLENLPPSLDLPTDRSRPAVQTYEGGIHRFTLDREVHRKLAALAAALETTPYTLLLAAFKLFLFRYSGQTDLAVGSPTAGRPRAGWQSTVGYFANPLVFRTDLAGAPSFRQLAKRVHGVALHAHDHGHMPFQQLVAWLQPERDPSRSPLFQAMFTFLKPNRLQHASGLILEEEAARINVGPLELGSVPLERRVTQFDLTLAMGESAAGGLAATLEYNRALFDDRTAARMADHFTVLLRAALDDPDRAITRLPTMRPEEYRQLTESWNDTASPLPDVPAFHRLFEKRAERVPDRIALIDEGQYTSYGALDRTAGHWARQLRQRGVGPESTVALYLTRSATLVTAVMSVLKAGGVYLPLDPDAPRKRLAFALADSAAKLVMTQPELTDALPDRPERLFPKPPAEPTHDSQPDPPPVRREHPAYLIYTSGSTGTPKAVIVSHGNLLNFAVAMGRHPAFKDPDRARWLAVTNPIFDISVLELLLPLTQGARTVVQDTRENALFAEGERQAGTRTGTRKMAFSLFYFADDEDQHRGDKYELLKQGARFADRHGFTAIWTPERHFHAFGGLYPNPSVIGAALATITERISIRAGSVVLPLHNPIRVAEEWSLVDNLSNGRVGISVASGWNADDFVLFPQNYGANKEIMVRDLETVRALWRGESITRPGGTGREVTVSIRPKPVQKELPVWLTAAGSIDTFRLAGKLGANLLTHLVGQSVAELGEKIAAYRQSRQDAGHDPERGTVTLMLHTFLDEDPETVRRKVERPFKNYLRSSLGLMKNLVLELGLDIRDPNFTEADMELLLTHAFNRYFETSALFGTPAECSATIRRLHALGVDEVGCLIDFGVDTASVMESLVLLDRVRRDFAGRGTGAPTSVAANLVNHRITHLQCTPSMARLLLGDPATRSAFSGLRHLLLGGEALSVELATEVDGLTGARRDNMYGPTETTIWSTSQQVETAEDAGFIGRPIANTGIYVLDRQGELCPPGVPGECHIGGEGLARGYLGKPDLTAGRFIPHPFQAPPGARLYATGDLIRAREDGRFAFIGRIDFQIKLRGHRIELGEIESALDSHPAVRKSAVAIATKAAAEPILTAFCQLRNAAEPVATESDLRSHLADRLPRYMVPARYRFLDRLPLTPNGKVDRNALDGMASVEPSRQERGEQPRNATESAMAEIWAGLLGIERPGIDDRFFALGGHSLLAMQLVARIEKVFSTTLPIRAVFENPTIRTLCALIHEPGRHAEPLKASGPPLKARELGPRPRLSFAQERLWFLDRLEGDHPAYNMCFALRLDGPMDTNALEPALSTIGSRHRILHASFPEEQGKPYLHIHPEFRQRIPLIDLGRLPAANAEILAMTLLENEHLHRFDLANGPLSRTTVLRMGPGRHLLLQNIHHIVADGWSIGNLLRELAALYKARVALAQPEALLPELTVQYADYADWQRQTMQGEVLKSHLDFWRAFLQDAPAEVALPLDFPRTAHAVRRAGQHRFRMDATLRAGLVGLAEKSDASLFMVLEALLLTLLHRYGGQDDLVLGCPVANRARPELEPLIGFFVNTLALRHRLEGDPAFLDLLRGVRPVVLDAMAHRELPFEKLADALGPERAKDGSRLFQVVFVHEKDLLREAGLHGLKVSNVPVPPGFARFDLVLIVRESGMELEVMIDYDLGLFLPETAARMAGHFQTLARSVVADAERRLSQLPVLTGEERRLLLGSWSESPDPVPFPRQNPALQMAACAQRSPDSAAAVYEQSVLTYGALADASDRLAGRLAGLGAGTGKCVAFRLDRSLEAVVAMLGILKTGAAFVPMAGDLPARRVSQIIMDCRAGILIQNRGSERVPDFHGACIETPAFPEGPAACVADPEFNGESPAYVLFTSGSTGLPKGAAVPMAALCNLIAWFADRFEIGPATNVLQPFPLGFDASIKNVFSPLVRGAKTVMLDAGPFDPEKLLQTIARQQVHVFNAVPGMVYPIMEPAASSGYLPLASLRYLILGGEPTRPARLRAWLEHPRCRCRLVNIYGPTECADSALYMPVPPEAYAGSQAPPIGRPVSNFRVFVTGRQLQPLPVGASGELVIGGPGLAHGYLRQPGLTACGFVPNPFSGSGQRLYRTGDLVKWLPDGTVLFLGRTDHQVKLRGFRIEPGEVEAAILGHEAVGDAAVVVREDRPGEKRLVAYLSTETTQIDIGDLREFLKKRLPAYMVPASFVTLNKLPRMKNGKLDRDALPLPERETPAGEQEHAPPRNRTERLLLEIWSDLLHLSEIGIHDNFFELGGDSILGIQVVARARTAGMTLTPKQIFEYQTVAKLAERVQAVTVNITAEPRPRGKVPLTPVQRFFLESDPIDPHHFNQAVLLSVSPDLDSERLGTAVNALVERHDALRLRFAKDADGEWSQAYDSRQSPSEAPYQVRDLGPLPSEDRSGALAQAAAEVQASLNLEFGPLMRAVHFKNLDERGRLLLVIHHLAVDGVSWRILLEDLFRCYGHLSEGRAPSLPVPTASFKAWSQHLAALARSDSLKEEIPFWQDQVRDADPVPLDFEDGENLSAGAGLVSISLTPEETGHFLREANSAYRTNPEELLLTALAQTMASRGRRLMLALERHGRQPQPENLDLSETVGWFTAVFPMALGPVDEDRDRALKTIRAQVRAVPNHGIGYGLLRYGPQSVEMASRGPASDWPNLVFNYLGRLDGGFNAADLAAPATEKAGPSQSPRATRLHALEINASVIGGSLRVDWEYGKALHRETTVPGWAESFMARLRSLLDFCCRPGAGGAAVSDFPLAGLDRSNLERLWKEKGPFQDLYRLAPLQEGILYYTRFNPEDRAYFQQMCCALRGPLDTGAFQRAWETAVQRHDALRTAFFWENLPHPVQAVFPRVALPFRFEDWSHVAEGERRNRLREFMEQDRERGFDPGNPPLMRHSLIRVEENLCYWVWSHHHLLMDGWSTPVILTDVWQCYEAEIRGEPLALGPPPSYREFITWLDTVERSEAEAFWRAHLRGYTDPVPITDPDPFMTRKRGGSPRSHSCRLSRETTAALTASARKAGLTLSTWIHGAWGLLLSRYGGSGDVVCGITVSGRTIDLAGVDRCVGLFINSLPARFRIEPETSLRDWLHRLQLDHAERERFVYCPLAEIGKWSELPRQMPLFEHVLVIENYPVSRELRKLRGSIRVESVESHERADYPLALAIKPGEEMVFRFDYDSGRYGDGFVQRLASRLIAILERMTENPEQRLRDLPLTTNSEMDALLAAWNRPARNFPHRATIHDLFETQARRTPQAIALASEDRQLSYGFLDTLGNRIAELLNRSGVSPDDRVGICLERSPLWIAGLLGILKAGGAYLPLDPDFPDERLASILADANARACFVNRNGRAFDSEVSCLELEDRSTASMLRGEGAVMPDRRLQPVAGSLAYVIFTSGSTGRPKGVAVPHRAVVRLHFETDYVDMGPWQRIPQFAHASFDAATFEVWGSLLHGGAILMTDREVSLNPSAFVQYIRGRYATIAFLTTALFDQIAKADSEAFASLNALLVGGEALDPKTIAAVASHRPPKRFASVYGPTENTTFSTWYPISRLESEASAVPIGKPIVNSDMFLLDRELRPVPPDLRAELFVGGPGLARCYLGHPRLTAAAFVPHPFSPIPGERIYRTGDLVFGLESGDAVFLGRGDHQVKWRGFRIELGEVEAGLNRHPLVDRAVVLLREDLPGEKQLAAYVQLREKGNAKQAVDQIRAALKHALPSYMIPSALTVMDRLPMTPSGKLDRRALPAPERATLDGRFEAPRTPLERELAAILAEVLRLERVGLHDNFFELGGHSLLAAQVITRVRTRFETDLPLARLFETPTVAQLAEHIENMRWMASDPGPESDSEELEEGEL